MIVLEVGKNMVAGYHDLRISDCQPCDCFYQVMCASAIIATNSIKWDYMASRTNQVSMQNSIQPSTLQL